MATIGDGLVRLILSRRYDIPFGYAEILFMNLFLSKKKI